MAEFIYQESPPKLRPAPQELLAPLGKSRGALSISSMSTTDRRRPGARLSGHQQRLAQDQRHVHGIDQALIRKVAGGVRGVRQQTTSSTRSSACISAFPS
jgi:hypothetical protein